MAACNNATPPSLKGITSTNDDPNLCAICSDPFPSGLYTRSSVLAECCGRRVCLGCNGAALYKKKGGNAVACSLCNCTFTNTIGMVKKHTKKGRPWAHFLLAMYYRDGQYVTQSHFEAMRWLRKAAGKSHPEAYLRLANYYVTADGRAQNLSEARTLLRKAEFLDPNLAKEIRTLLQIGEIFKGVGTREAIEESTATILPQAEAGVVEAQYNMGLNFILCEDLVGAEPWFVSAALQGDPDAPFFAMKCSGESGNFSQAKFWLTVATTTNEEAEFKEKRKEHMISFQRDLRELKDTCGACGEALDGKMRKMCKQCKVYCYCGRECQKLHWNMKGEIGHRDDCIAMIALKEKMRRASSKGNSDGD